MKRLLFFLVVLGIVFVFSPAAYCVDETGTFSVFATVEPECQVTSTSLDMGLYLPSKGLKKKGTVTVHCNDDTEIEIGLDRGSHYTEKTGNAPYREMTLGGNANTDFLEYQIWQPAPTGDQPWGDSTNTPNYGERVSWTSSGNPKNFNFDVEIPIGQHHLTPGQYSDVVNVLLYITGPPMP